MRCTSVAMRRFLRDLGKRDGGTYTVDKLAERIGVTRVSLYRGTTGRAKIPAILFRMAALLPWVYSDLAKRFNRGRE